MEKENAGLQISVKSFITSVIILFVLMMGAGVLTYVIPSGSFERVVVDGVEQILPGTFEYTNQGGLAVWRWFTAPIEVFWSEDAVTVISIIVFICIIGGTFTVLDKSNMLKFIMGGLVNKFKDSKYKLMASLILFFMAFGSIFGIFEELVALVPIVILLSYALGWDSITGLSMSALAAGFGFSAATLNPFTLGIAQNLAGIPMFSGIVFRIGVFAICYGMLYWYTSRYAKKLEVNPKLSSVYEEDFAQKSKYSDNTQDEVIENAAYLGKAVKIFVASVVIMISFIVLGFFVDGLSGILLPVMALIFLVGGLLSARAANYGGNIRKDFIAGIGAIAPSSLLIMMAMSVKLIITNGNIMDTILYFASETIADMGAFGAAIMIYVLVLCMNFFISSGSAKAFLLIPIIAPLADLVGLSRQIAVQAFCFGDGFSNLLYPTNALLMITLGVTVVSYTKWFKWSFPLQLLMSLVNMGLLVVAVMIGYN